MKRILIILLLSLFSNSYCQKKNNATEMAKATEKMFTWDIEKVEKGTMMFLDIPYQQEKKNTAEYLTLTVAKKKTQKRPDFISIIIPNNIDRKNGVFIKFGNDELEKEKPIKVQFEKCDNEICTARIIGGYVTDTETKEKVDIFQKFLSYKQVYFLFMYSDGSHKTVAVPLFSFKNQYKTI